MLVDEMLSLLRQGKRPYHLAGTGRAGVLVLPDLEGRVYTFWNGQILNRVNPAALTEASRTDSYYNPGGDGFWPAPEGTRLGYHYATGSWRVPAAIRHLRYHLRTVSANRVSLESEADLINAQGLGIPALFSRQIEVAPRPDGIDVSMEDGIRYLGSRTLKNTECLLAAWSLCQFDCHPDCEVLFPAAPEDVWEMYSGHTDACSWQGQFCHAGADTPTRYQLGIGSRVPWIEFRDPRRKLAVRRQAAVIPPDESYVDIRDADPQLPPDARGVRYSVYCDPAGFMEIEAAGGCPDVIRPGTLLTVRTDTSFTVTT